MIISDADRYSAAVQDALTRECKICGAAVGQICWHLGNYTLKKKIVHYGRTEP